MRIDRPTRTWAPICSAAAAPPQATYSQAVRVGDCVMTSGLAPVSVSGAIVGDTISDQVDQVVVNLRALLATQGLGLDDVVRATVYLQRLDRDYRAFDAAYARHFRAPLPARTIVGANLLGVLISADFMAQAGTHPTPSDPR